MPRFVQSSRLTIQPALAVENGIVSLAYNASDSPFFGDPLSGSNIFLLRSTDGGQTWTGPQQVNPIVAGEPRHVYPAIAIGSPATISANTWGYSTTTATSMRSGETTETK